MQAVNCQALDVEHPLAAQDVFVIPSDDADGVVIVVVMRHQYDVRRDRWRLDPDGATVVGIHDHRQSGVTELEAGMTVPSDPHSADNARTSIKRNGSSQAWFGHPPRNGRKHDK